MDFVKALTFVFDDPRWKEKVIWGTGLVLVSTVLSVIVVGVLGFLILAGYGVRLLQNVRDGKQYPLPEWDDWGGDFVRGFKYLIVGLVYAIPMIVFTIPLVIGGLITDSGNAGEFMGSMILLCGTCLMVLYGIFIFLAAPGFTIAFATDEHISSGLEFTEVWNWTRKNIGQVIIAIIVLIVANTVISFVASAVGTLLCVVGLIVTIPLSILAYTVYQYHIYGQLAYLFPYGGLGGNTVLAGYSDPVTPAPIAPVVTEPVAPEEPVEPETGMEEGTVDEGFQSEDTDNLQ